MTDVKLYWWRGRPNFGDQISQRIVGAISRRKTAHAANTVAEFFAAGSILRGAILAWGFDNPPARQVIWGTGLKEPLKKDELALLDAFKGKADVVAVRGPKTAEHLGITVKAYGDPGILVDRFCQRQCCDGKIGFVRHYAHDLSDEQRERLEGDPRFKIIEAGSPYTWRVVREIAKCRFVFSSSLHGLVVADSFGIDNQWVSSGTALRRPEFKFQDYAKGVGRKMKPAVSLDEMFDLAGSLPEGFCEAPHRGKVEAAKTSLLAAFPESLVRPI